MPAKTPTREHMPVYFFIALLTLFSACGILGSDDNKEPLEPGPRNYEWTVDTLHNGPGVFYNIWGSSPDDVWAVSSGGLHAVWHFDGNKWEPYEESNIIYSAEAVYGFSEDNVWTGGNDGRLYHFDGNTWQLDFQYEKSGLNTSHITDIWGNSPSNMYAAGTFYMLEETIAQGLLLHFNGDVWREVLATDFGVQFQRVRIEKNIPLIQAVKSTQNGNDTLMIYKYTKGNLEEIISYTKSEVRSISIVSIGEHTYYYKGNTISKFKKDGFEEFLILPGLEEIIRVDGRHEKDIFIHTWTETFHYNGKDLYPILEDLPRNVFRTQLFSKEVFFVIWDVNNGTTLVYHGTLTEKEEEEP